MTDQEQIAHANKVMWRSLAVLGIIWILGLAVFIYVGETTLWASESTKALPPSTGDQAMNFTAMICNVDEKTPWRESFNVAGVTTQEQAEKWTRETVEWFNSTLRSGEVRREVVSVQIGEGSATLDHHWTKVNLITQKDHRGMFDNVRCERCGATARRYGLTAIKRSAKFKAQKWASCPGKLQ